MNSWKWRWSESSSAAGSKETKQLISAFKTQQSSRIRGWTFTIIVWSCYWYAVDIQNLWKTFTSLHYLHILLLWKYNMKLKMFPINQNTRTQWQICLQMYFTSVQTYWHCKLWLCWDEPRTWLESSHLWLTGHQLEKHRSVYIMSRNAGVTAHFSVLQWSNLSLKPQRTSVERPGDDLWGSVRKKGINCLNPGVIYLRRSELYLLSEGLLHTNEIRFWIFL